MSDPYMISKDSFKWYILPTCEFLDVIPFPNKYLSFWFKSNAEVVLSAMNASWRDGYRFNSFFKDKTKIEPIDLQNL